MTTKSNLGSDQYTLDKETAQQYINSWRDETNSIVSTALPATDTQFQLNSFSFSIEDFKDFVTRVENDPLSNEITGVVCHIGIKPNPIPDTIPAMVPCLIFEALLNYDTSSTPINPGKCLGDLVPLETSASAGTIIRTSARYDFSYPCPATCPTGEI